MEIKRNHNIAALAVIAAVSLVVMGRQLAVPGIYSCLLNDTIYYLNWTRQVADSLSQGVFYPRWMPDSHGGFGNPVFVFYPPLTVFLTALVKITSGSVITAATVIKFSGLFLSGVTMFIFASGLWGRRAGVAAAAAYITLPFRIYDLYILGVFASKMAYAWFPLVMHFSGKTAREESAGRNTALLAASYAGLCLTHLLSAYMIAPFALAFALLRAKKGMASSAALRTVCGIGLGLIVSAFYLLPVLLENGLVHFEMLLSKEHGDFRHNFTFYVFEKAPPMSLPIFGYVTMTVKSSAAAGMAFFTSYLLSREDRRAEPFFFLGVTAVTLFLMSSVSRPVWEYTPGMKMLQFGARWASITVFALSCIIGVAVGRLQVNKLRKRRLYVGMTAALVLSATAWAVYHDFDVITRGCRLDVQDVADAPKDMDVLEYVPKTVSLDWLRKQHYFQKKPMVSPLNPTVPVRIDIEEWKSVERRFITTTETDTRVSIRTFNYPGWRAYIDGKKTVIGTQEVTGAMILNIPAGSHEVVLRFGTTAVRRAAWGLSAVAAIVIILLLRRGCGMPENKTCKVNL